MRKIIVLLLPLFFLSGCSLGRTIDTSTDYSSSLKDGDYQVSSMHYDSFGFKKQMAIAVRQGLITEINYTETDKNGTNRASLNGQKWVNCEYNFNQIVSQLNDTALVTQTRQFDAVSGATKTCEDYQILLASLLSQAQQGPNEMVVDRFNDTYESVNTPSGLMQEKITVVFEKGNLKDITIEELGQAPANVSRAFSTLATLSETKGDLSPITDSQVDPEIVSRYNGLLEQVNNLR